MFDAFAFLEKQSDLIQYDLIQNSETKASNVKPGDCDGYCRTVVVVVAVAAV